ncbi:MAG: hypothetical protein IJX28_02280 [Clostridia bacterium]|nr:hypothetical protein [Clostridia bacterium]
MNKSYLFRGITLLLILCLLCGSLVACKDEPIDPSTATKLSFKSASSYEYLKGLDGQAVTINGYLATSSPADGSFIFLMNLPFQSCPFCIPNTSQLSNTVEVYPQKNQKFEYTTQAVKVVGRLEVAPSEDKPFTDDYGYQFNFKIVDATYTILKDEDLTEDLALWQKIASSGVVDEMYQMYEYLNFLCFWNTYSINSYVDSNGEVQPGYYLYASDALNFLVKDGAQFNYGYKDGYFEGIIADIEAVDPNAFEDLEQNVRDAKALAEWALKELTDGNYTSEYKYVEKFETYDYIYTITNGAALEAQMNTLYTAFSDWIGSWEL